MPWKPGPCDLGGQAFAKLKEAIKDGRMSEAVLDSAAFQVLRLKFAMGLFDNPYVDPKKAKKEVHTAESVELARKMAQQSTVLLENNGILPLSKKGLKLAVIGPNADMMYNQLGDYTAPQPEQTIITVLEGIVAKVGASNVVYEKGCAIRDTTDSNISAAVKAAQNTDVTIVVVGGSSARDFNTRFQATGAAEANTKIQSDMESGEGNDRQSLELMGHQLKLLKALKATGKPLVVVYIEAAR
jgi:beta-glucosidase